ncbi:MAG TPA: tRNA (guanosine(46)-N7)-methyltransferase TrmB, partial [Paludibacteraceae bacterium]|nr:tRNA (guanosine(46)-N7)-methyltransferase TrmB [Paludibacteraceae bacterium]
MSRNKLSKFADMNSFPHVFQFPAYPFYRSDTEFN